MKVNTSLNFSLILFWLLSFSKIRVVYSKTKTFLVFYAHFLNFQEKIGLFVLFETAKMHFEQILKLFWFKNVPYKRWPHVNRCLIELKNEINKRIFFFNHLRIRKRNCYIANYMYYFKLWWSSYLKWLIIYVWVFQLKLWKNIFKPQ